MERSVDRCGPSTAGRAVSDAENASHGKTSGARPPECARNDSPPARCRSSSTTCDDRVIRKFERGGGAADVLVVLSGGKGETEQRATPPTSNGTPRYRVSADEIGAGRPNGGITTPRLCPRRKGAPTPGAHLNLRVPRSWFVKHRGRPTDLDVRRAEATGDASLGFGMSPRAARPRNRSRHKPHWNVS